MNFKHVYLFLVLSGTFDWKIYSKHLKSASARLLLPRGNFCVLFTWRKVTSARRVTQCCTKGNPPLEVAPGQRETHVNSYRRQTVHRGKVDPRVSELPRGNELSRDHVNGPLVIGSLDLKTVMREIDWKQANYFYKGFLTNFNLPKRIPIVTYFCILLSNCNYRNKVG